MAKCKKVVLETDENIVVELEDYSMLADFLYCNSCDVVALKLKEAASQLEKQSPVLSEIVLQLAEVFKELKPTPVLVLETL